MNDSYFGSGSHLKNSINKHGIENFTKEILFIFDDVESMNSKEREIVNEEFVSRSDTYNIELGGSGGFIMVNGLGLNGFSKDIKYARAARYSTNEKLKKKYGDNWHEIVTKMASDARQKLHKEKFNIDSDYTERYKSMARRNQKQMQSEKAIAKKRKTLQEIGHAQGEKNSQFGSMWITNGFENKKIKKDDLIPEEWYKGRKI